MTTPRYTFKKGERLRKKTYIESLFEANKSFLCYPLKFFYREIEEVQTVPVQVLIVVPKKKLRKAVDRNLIKRRIRETYRIRKETIIDKIQSKRKLLLLGVMYLSDKKIDYKQIDNVMEKGIEKLREKL